LETSSTISDEKAPDTEATKCAPACDDVHDVINVGNSNEITDQGEEVLYRQTTPISTGNEFSNDRLDTEEFSGQSQRPARATRRPSRFRDTAFETRFRPEDRKKCLPIGRGDQLKSERMYYELGRGDQAEKVDNFDVRAHTTQKSPSYQEWDAAGQQPFKVTGCV